MDNKFKNVPLDEDTRLKSSRKIELEGLNALHQVWIWEDVRGESVIFADDDVKDLTEEEIKKLVLDSAKKKEP